MGEISEAMRRARAERDLRSQQDPPLRAADTDSSVLVDSEADWGEPSAVAARTEPQAPSVQILDTRTAPWAARAALVDQGMLAEHFRHFALRVRRVLEGRRARTVVVTSPLQQEGKTTIACNLALALGSVAGSRRIALVDMDLGNPSVSEALGVTPRTGFELVLSGKASLRSAELRTQIPALDLFLIDRPCAQAHEVLASPKLGTTLRQLSKRYDTVVLDAPPVLPVPDVPLILGHAEACITVVQAGSTRRTAFSNMMEVLPKEKLVGVFVNRARAPKRSERYGRYPENDPRPGMG